MNTLVVKDNLASLKTDFEAIHNTISEGLKQVEEKGNMYKEVDMKIENFSNQNLKRMIQLNVGGKIFHVFVSTLLIMKDTLFYLLIKSYLEINKDIPEELFLDRNYTHFPLILNFLKNNKINFRDVKRLDMEEVNEEIKFYGMCPHFTNPKMMRLREIIPESFWVDDENIVLRGWHNKFVKCYLDGRVMADQDIYDVTEMWTPEIDDDDYISLKSHYDTYLNDNSCSILNAVKITEPGTNQKFKFTRTEKTASGKEDGWGIETKVNSQFIVFETKSKKYLCSHQPDGRIECNRTEPGPWEKFSGSIMSDH